MVTRPPPADITINPPRDPNTLSNYNNFRTTHTRAVLDIEFEPKRVFGTVHITLKSLTHGETKDLILDTSYLDIEQVRVGERLVKWTLEARAEPYGAGLSIALDAPVAKGEDIEVAFLNVKQSMPDVKSTYDFLIRSPLPVLASGLPKGASDFIPGKHGRPATLLYRFHQPIPMPSYLFAIASGDLASASIGPRSTVWTGPDELTAAKWEFEEDTENFIEAAEKIVYPYAWTMYNVLVLPPSFPYGGMENPQWTYATPTIVSGDRANVDVIAHELSHSWSGNLVSNASWEHFWLNEGWTTYLERRIQAAIHGESHRDFSAIIGWKALQDSVKKFGEDHEFTKLVVDLKGKDPDDAFSSVPYEKGFVFLYSLEKMLGKEKWDEFIPHYFTTYREKSLDSYDFKSTLLDFFANDQEASQILSELDWDAAFYKPGYPAKPDFDTSMVDVCYELADQWEALSKGDGKSDFKPQKQDIDGWLANQSVVFLERVQNFPEPLSVEQVEIMGEAYDYGKSQNVELVSRYFQIGLRARAQSIYRPAAQLLGRVGRMKFVRPLFRELKKADRELAFETFEENRLFYHPICRAMVEKDLFGDDPTRKS
ncbi:MAG: hypothetical protein Q9157_001774 [Trypethelium eluteriae]